jgi:hypothetical protein
VSLRDLADRILGLRQPPETVSPQNCVRHGRTDVAQESAVVSRYPALGGETVRQTTCSYCRKPLTAGDPLLEASDSGHPVWLHQACVRAWDFPELPAFLDRRLDRRAS